MSEIEFEGDFNQSSQGSSPSVDFGTQQNYYPQQSQSGGMTGWLMEKGIIKEESQAKGVLVGVILFNMCVTGFVIYYFIL